jgi:endonuclease G, mitochondrial
MSTQEKVNALLEAIRSRDEELGDEMRASLEGRTSQEGSFRLVRESALDAGVHGAKLTPETIVLRSGRPVLAVSNDEPALTFQDAESEVWRERLVRARPKLITAIRAVGRVELKNNPRFDWVGTGWLVAHDIVVTNRHVALEFGKHNSEGFVFRRGIGGENMAASINFLAEFGRDDTRAVSVTRILHIEDEEGPDLAFLQVQADAATVPIPLSTDHAVAKQKVAVIGYPARDSRIPDQALMENLFGNVYDKKRLAPGQVIKASADDLEHDCSTLGGNSGSVVLGLGDGQAMGVHFAGRFLEANFAVPGNIIAERLETARSGKAGRRPVFSRTSDPSTGHIHSSVNDSQGVNGSSVTFTIPIRITVAVHAPSLAPSVAPATSGHDVDVPFTEGVVQDYRDREGYEQDFLGAGHEIPLPEVVRNSAQVLEFEVDGHNDHVLRYQHFSVVMDRKRRMCFFSAANVDGKLSRKAERTTWRIDPRIPKNLQIMYECYGNPPKFSRGHMTRREDPVWGTAAEAARGNSDSMHVTNVTPQMQSFNAPIWLGLEDYALQNARRDKVRISVITGPILRDNDPVRYGVKIPRAFWKVIAFIHDKTERLSATGYSISQVDHIREEEFVYGAYETYQQPLSWIEEKAGVSFGALTDLDPLARATEAIFAPLAGFDQIRFSS